MPRALSRRHDCIILRRKYLESGRESEEKEKKNQGREEEGSNNQRSGDNL